MIWDINRAALYIIVLIRWLGGVYIREERIAWTYTLSDVMKYALSGLGFRG